MAHVYILRCGDGTFYTGSTIDLDRRLAEHQNGDGARYTRERLPVELIWSAEFDRIDDAFGWEKRIQGWTRAKKMLLMQGRFDELFGRSARERAGRRSDAASRESGRP